MKLTKDQKTRIAVFMTTYPLVSHMDVAELFNVARTTITRVVHDFAVPNQADQREYAVHYIDAKEMCE